MSMKENNWIDRNTFHHSDFWDLIKLVEEKEKKGTQNFPLHSHFKRGKNHPVRKVLILRSELMGALSIGG